MAVMDQRRAAIAVAVDEVRGIVAHMGVTRAALEAIKPVLVALGQRTDLFPREHFTISPGRAMRSITWPKTWMARSRCTVRPACPGRPSRRGHRPGAGLLYDLITDFESAYASQIRRHHQAEAADHGVNQQLPWSADPDGDLF